jgi:thiamine-monophosphate kinase
MGSPASEEPVDEFERIRRFFAPLAAPGGLGLLDDAALLDCRAGRQLVITADVIVEGVHYLPDDPPDTVARKLLRVNLSDLAAMGARPLHYLLTTALPATRAADWVAAFARGLGEDQERFKVSLLGGDSVASPGPAALSLTAIGEVSSGMAVRRSGAVAGDQIWVSGTIGDASLGLDVLRGAHSHLAAEHRAALASRFRLPEPRIELGPRLVGLAHAMIDISDGLLADLGHICETSHLAARIELEALPLSAAARAIIDRQPDLRALLAARGDDYELLFTAAPSASNAIEQLSTELHLPITQLGVIEPGKGVRLLDSGGRVIPVAEPGYRHF